jgi:hypothetical protein
MTPCKCDGLHCGGAPTLNATTVLAVGSVHQSHRVLERALPEINRDISKGQIASL